MIIYTIENLRSTITNYYTEDVKVYYNNKRTGGKALKAICSRKPIECENHCRVIMIDSSYVE